MERRRRREFCDFNTHSLQCLQSLAYPTLNSEKEYLTCEKGYYLTGEKGFPNCEKGFPNWDICPTCVREGIFTTCLYLQNLLC